MTDFLEELETLRLIRAFSRIKDPDKRKLVLQFVEAAMPTDDPARGTPNPATPAPKR
ncbi:hypothetical protein JQ633_28965 [Bradyrhizobium tropiciagri]|uniref:hypothetical protein n=1 Tax=Bradyrhizobium tropiciagri TaxID=312253 RepID=UPI001BA43D3F|nr:hypothetical protein [Bradyrhizobium tropiciagri]MBR0874418.1 hypothetical protein [Bradyrhizobium tropiciagri]